jgi:hypothetical protein
LWKRHRWRFRAVPELGRIELAEPDAEPLCANEGETVGVG